MGTPWLRHMVSHWARCPWLLEEEETCRWTVWAGGSHVISWWDFSSSRQTKVECNCVQHKNTVEPLQFNNLPWHCILLFFSRILQNNVYCQHLSAYAHIWLFLLHFSIFILMRTFTLICYNEFEFYFATKSLSKNRIFDKNELFDAPCFTVVSGSGICTLSCGNCKVE